MSYRTRDQLIGAFTSLEIQYPNLISHEYIGKTVNELDIPLFKVGNPSGGRVMFVGGIHGDELLGPELYYYFCRWLLERQEPQYTDPMLSNNLFLIVPIFNMDNYKVRRKNMNGVDLNRNFPIGWGGDGSSSDPNAYNYKGVASSSEPETKAMLSALEKWQPNCFLDHHIWAGPYFARPTNYTSMSTNDVTKHNTIATAVRNLSIQRISYAFPYLQLGIGGCLTDSAYKYGNAISYLNEAYIDPAGQVNPPYADIIPIHLSRFLPFSIVFGQNAQNPPTFPAWLIAVLVGLGLVYFVEKL